MSLCHDSVSHQARRGLSVAHLTPQSSRGVALTACDSQAGEHVSTPPPSPLDITEGCSHEPVPVSHMALTACDSPVGGTRISPPPPPRCSHEPASQRHHTCITAPPRSGAQRGPFAGVVLSAGRGGPPLDHNSPVLLALPCPPWLPRLPAERPAGDLIAAIRSPPVPRRGRGEGGAGRGGEEGSSRVRHARQGREPG